MSTERKWGLRYRFSLQSLRKVFLPFCSYGRARISGRRSYLSTLWLSTHPAPCPNLLKVRKSSNDRARYCFAQLDAKTWDSYRLRLIKGLHRRGLSWIFGPRRGDRLRGGGVSSACLFNGPDSLKIAPMVLRLSTVSARFSDTKQSRRSAQASSATFFIWTQTTQACHVATKHLSKCKDMTGR